MNDTELNFLRSDALSKFYLQEFYSQKSSTENIKFETDWLKKQHLGEKSKVESIFQKFIANAEKKDLAETTFFIKRYLAEKKAAGVVVGMSMDDVLARSRGRPNNVNKTGDREQWVYGSGNYLYFENSRLITIQN